MSNEKDCKNQSHTALNFDNKKNKMRIKLSFLYFQTNCCLVNYKTCSYKK